MQNKGILDISTSQDAPQTPKITMGDLLKLNRHARRSIGKKIGMKVPGIHIPLTKNKK